MQKLESIIIPQMQLVSSRQPLAIPDDRPRRMDEELEVLYGEVVMPGSMAHEDIPLPNCKVCRQPYGGVQHGWVREELPAQAIWGNGQKTRMIPCPKCGPAAQEALREKKAQEAQNFLLRMFGNANIPWYAQDWEFDTFPSEADADALKITQEFVASHLACSPTAKRGLYLAGQPGRGKTSLAISALKEIMRHRAESGLYVMVLELMDRIRGTYSKGAAIGHDELIAAVCTVPWLILDDLAVEKPTDFVIQKLYYIIEKRRSAGLYTIITSNLSTKGLEAYWRPEGVAEGAFHPGTRVVERLREYCLGTPVKGMNLREGSW